MIKNKSHHRARRTFIKSAAAMSSLAVSGLAALPVFNIVTSTSAEAAAPLDHSTIIEENGFLTQNWYLDSFLDLSEDLGETADEKKRFAIIWEQKGCPYCREMHMVNFSTPVIRDWIQERFNIVQLDIWGSREVTDFDGEVLQERELAEKSRVMFTPTMQFFPAAVKEIAGKSGGDSEVFRMPGYFKRFHFITMFEYVHGKAYEKEGFQRFLINKVQHLNETGQQIDVW